MGIDLGTTNSVVAVVGDDGHPRILEAGGERIIPSVVAVTGKGETLVGAAARNYLPVDPENAVRSAKRSMGTTDLFPLAGETYTPQQISALVIRKLKALAETALGESVTRAVITVPAYFSDQQRIATREAGELAGLEVVRIINEPTAAALAYSSGRDIGRRVLVYDLGGGTFDVSLVQIDGSIVEVLATAGHNRLGGDDFDRRIVDEIAEKFATSAGVDLRGDVRALARLTAAAEQAKITLSDHPYARVQEDFIATGEGGEALHLDEELSRQHFEELIDDLLGETIDLVDRVLKDAQCRPKGIDKILLVGGSTRIPAVRHRLTKHLRQEPAGEVHPDECVALGAAVQAAIIDGAPVDAILVDVTAHSLGIETVEFTGEEWLHDRYSVVIPRNSVIPCEKAEVYYTVRSGQEKVTINVYQGEHAVASMNDLLGTFSLENLPKRPAGEVEVLVTFAMGLDGIVQVTAEGRGTDRHAQIVVRDPRSRLDEADKAEAEAAVVALWEGTGQLDAATEALLSKAEAAAGEMDDAAKQQVLDLVAQIRSIHAEGIDEREEELDDLEEQLLDLLGD
jgi:molecular chaperone DnaK